MNSRAAINQWSARGWASRFNAADDGEGGGAGTDGDLVCGFLLGFVIGPLMLFWLWERSLSRKLKVGIVCGVVVQVFVSWGPSMHGSWSSSSSGGGGDGKAGSGRGDDDELLPVMVSGGSLANQQR